MTDTISPSPAAAAMGDDPHGHRLRQRLAFTIGCVVCGLITLGLARLLKIPLSPGRGGILLQQHEWWFAMGITWLIIIAGSALSAIVASRVHYEGGLFCACVGLAALSVRLGPTRFALFSSTVGAKVYLLMALELLLLAIAVAVGWVVLRLMARLGWLPPELPIDDSQPEEPMDQKILAITAQIVVTMILVLLLARSDQKAQVLAAAFVSSYLGALAAHHFVPAQPSMWFWLGPLIVGILGHVMQYFSPTDWEIGDARGFFAPLARLVPLDYASLGTAGALLGYWTSQKWQRDRVASEGTQT
jgi:hypothetical protein